MKNGDFEHLIGRIYDAALDVSAWHAVVQDIAERLGAASWHLMGRDTGSGKSLLDIYAKNELFSDAALDRYNRHFGAIDPRFELAAREPGVVISCHQHFDAGFVSRSEFFQDFMLPLGLRYSMGGSLHRDDLVDYKIGLHREPDRGVFGSAEAALLGRLMPHLQRSIRLMERTRLLAASRHACEGGLDAVSQGVIALDATWRVVYCNRYGEAMLRAGSVLALQHGRLACRDTRAHSQLTAALDAASRTGHPKNLMLDGSARPESRLSLTVVPLRTSPKGIDRAAISGTATTLICLLAPLDRQRGVSGRQLMELFGLTPAEARLARALVAGASLKDYGDEWGLKISTVKTQLGQVFLKTGTDRQSKLVRLLCLIPAVREKAPD